MMRVVLNILAVLGGLFCALLALGCCILFVGVIMALIPNSYLDKPLGLKVAVFMMAVATGFALLGFLFAARNYRHLRRPDQTTARNVFGIACLLLGAELITLIHGRPNRAGSADYFANPTDAWGSLGIVVVLFLFHRLVLRRLAARVFPSGAPPPTSSPSNPPEATAT